MLVAKPVTVKLWLVAKLASLIVELAVKLIGVVVLTHTWLVAGSLVCQLVWIVLVPTKITILLMTGGVTSTTGVVEPVVKAIELEVAS